MSQYVVDLHEQSFSMSDVTRILSQIEDGDSHAAEKLLPYVYDELRKLAASRLAQEKPGQTLQATALVHEAYVRLVDVGEARNWNSRAHFFGAAAEAMRRILIERVRGKARIKHGGGVNRVDDVLCESIAQEADNAHNILAIDEALSDLERHDQLAAQLVKLRYFAGMQHTEAAESLGISRRKADRLWLLARTWLIRRLRDE